MKLSQNLIQKIILNEDFESIGKRGEIVNVKSGYARNFLIPQGIAISATERNIEIAKRQIEINELKEANKEAYETDKAKKTEFKDKIEYILLNPGAFTHTSISIRDALLAIDIPFIEIHLSNTFAREEYRHTSYFSDIAAGCLFGLGKYGYELALRAAAKQLLAPEDQQWILEK